MITKFYNVPPLIKIAVNNGPVLELTQLCIYHKTIRPGGITYCQMVGKHAFCFFFSINDKHCPTFIPDWSVVIIKLKRGPTTKVDEKGDELLMKTTVKLEKGKSLFHFPENF